MENQQQISDEELESLFRKLCEDVAYLADRARKLDSIKDTFIRKAE